MRFFSAVKQGAKQDMRGHWAGGALLVLIESGAAVLISVLQQVALSLFVIRPVLEGVSPGGLAQNGYLETAGELFILSKPEWIITSASVILQILLLFPLSLGVIRWYIGVMRGQSPSLTEAFYFYESPSAYWRAIWLDISIGLRSALWGFLFIAIPGCLLGFSVDYLSSVPELDHLPTMIATACLVFSIVLLLIAILLFAAFLNRYAFTAYLICEDESMTVRQAIKASVAYTKGFRFNIMWFGLSFFGWFLLCLFLLPIFYVGPYYTAAYVRYADCIIGQKRQAGNSR